MGNECERCGACCVDFLIYNDTSYPWGYIFKKQDKVCQYLNYNFDTNQASCLMHNADKPEACQKYCCSNDPIRVSRLRETAKKMPEIMREHLKSRDIKQT